MDPSQYAYHGQYTDQYTQQQQYQSGVPQIRNPFAPSAQPFANPYAAAASAFLKDPEEEAQLAAWNAQYVPADTGNKTDTASSKPKDAGPSAIGPRVPKFTKQSAEQAKPLTVVRKGGGTQWEDNSLLEWDPSQFRIIVGNLAGEVTDDSLAKAFAAYGVAKARVVRDKRSQKSKGFGFVSFTDGELGFKAAREMVGKYIGSHPVTIQRSKTDIRPSVPKPQHKGGRHGKNKHDKAHDPLKANTGAHIEKKAVRNPAAGAFKVIG